MRYSAQVNPIGYLNANLGDILLNLVEKREPVVIAQNGDAKAVIQNVTSFQQTQEALALLKLLAIGNQDINAGKTSPARGVVERSREKASNSRRRSGSRP